MTTTVYTDALIEACAHASYEAHRATGFDASGWDSVNDVERNISREDARLVLSGEMRDDCPLCTAVVLAVAAEMGWERKP